MSRMFPWERWPTVILGVLCLLLPDFSPLASIHTVPSTCGHEFFLPPLHHMDSSSLVRWVEVVACRDASRPPVPVTLTVCTVSSDVVHTLSISSNETARVDVDLMARKDQSIGKRGLRLSTSQKTSAYAHLSSGSDVMTIIPFDAITTSYLIPDLRTSDFEEQRVFFYNIYSRTNVSLTTCFHTEYDTWPGDDFGGEGDSEIDNDSGRDGKVTNAVSKGGTDVINSTSKTGPASGHSDKQVSPAAQTFTASDGADRNYRSNSNSNSNHHNRTSLLLDDGHSSFATTTNNNVTHSIFFLSSAMQTRSYSQDLDTSVLLVSDKPLGVLVLLSFLLLLFLFPFLLGDLLLLLLYDEVTRGGGAAGEGEVEEEGEGGGVMMLGGEEGEGETWMMEMVWPLSSLGKRFYLPLMDSFSYVKLVVSGQENGTVDIAWDSDKPSLTTSYNLTATRSLLLEQPIRNLPVGGHVWLSSTSPVLVYVVIDMCLSSRGGGDKPRTGGEPECDVNAFFLPPLEQYFRCSVHTESSTCDTECPSFWNSGTCSVQAEVLSNSSESGRGGSNAMNPTSGRNSGAWQVQHTVNATVPNVTDSCVVANNNSYLPFRLVLGSATFLPAGTRLAKMYSACVPNISAQGGEGDGVDNDCDGVIDEEAENMKDDDGDERIDEDTWSGCPGDASLRTARSDSLQKAVAEAGPPAWPFYDYEEEDSEMPLLAVIISLSVAIFAVIAVISIFLLMELMSRRRQIRNTKIRPFVS